MGPLFSVNIGPTFVRRLGISAAEPQENISVKAKWTLRHPISLNRIFTLASGLMENFSFLIRDSQGEK